MGHGIIIAVVLIGWVISTVALHRAFAPPPARHPTFLIAVACDTLLAAFVIGSIWRDWTS